MSQMYGYRFVALSVLRGGNEKGKHKLGNRVRGQAAVMEGPESRGKGVVWEPKPCFR